MHRSLMLQSDDQLGVPMVLFISYRKKLDSAELQLKLRKTFFAEYSGKPSFDEVKALVKRVSQGDFAEETVEFQECVGFDPKELTKAGMSVHRLEAVGEPERRPEAAGARKDTSP